VIPLRDVNPTRRRALVTIGLIAICIAVYLLEVFVQATSGQDGFERLIGDWGLVPARLTGQGGGDAIGGPPALLTIFSSMFLHADPLHIGGNMLYLWIFGNNVEDRLGRPLYLVFYLAGGVLAALAQVAIAPDSAVPVIGASGAIAAVLGAYLVLYPRARVQTLVYLGFFYQLIQIPAVVILGFWFILQVMSAVISFGDPAASGGVALFAHIGGFGGGVLVGLVVRGAGDRGDDGPRLIRPTDRFGVG
jgi:membrane associated rhomboid family serine protease